MHRFYSIFSIDSNDYSEDQYMRCSCLCLAQICSGYTQSKNETNYNSIIAASKRYTRMLQIHLSLRVKYF